MGDSSKTSGLNTGQNMNIGSQVLDNLDVVINDVVAHSSASKDETSASQSRPSIINNNLMGAISKNKQDKKKVKDETH